MGEGTLDHQLGGDVSMAVEEVTPFTSLMILTCMVKYDFKVEGHGLTIVLIGYFRLFNGCISIVVLGTY